MKKVLIAMSGGVDSSVAACLLKEAGYDCVGCTMRLYRGEENGGESRCCSLDDTEDARAVALRLGIRHYVFNFCDEFKKQVVDRFAAAYRAGKTPNPCVDCNRYMKFGKLLTRADELGCDFVATGHYARVERSGGRWLLKKAADPEKDQSYVLFRLTQADLSRVLFPLGDLTKAETRRIAGENGFVNAEKPESQDICFVPDGDHAAAICRLTGQPEREGDFVDAAGRVLGRHRGISRYTVGQRRGLGIAAAHPLYVVAVRAADNTVVLGEEKDLYHKEMTLTDVHWIAGEVPAAPVSCAVKIRYRQKEQPAVVTPTGPDTAAVTFRSPQRAITPGQSAVFYDGDVVLGGGEIVGTTDASCAPDAP